MQECHLLALFLFLTIYSVAITSPAQRLGKACFMFVLSTILTALLEAMNCGAALDSLSGGLNIEVP